MRLERENARLKDELEAARRAGARQAAPFSKGAPKRRPRCPGRKPGRGYGRQGQRPVPAMVHETHDVPLPATCPTCGEAVVETHVAAQYQEDLPPVTPVVRRFDIHVGLCGGCQRRVQGRHPLQTSDALGAAGVQLGPQAIALAASLNKQFGVSFGKIATMFRERFGLHVTPSAIVRALHRVAAKGQPTYGALCETVRTSAVVVPDETGWKVGGLLHWLWVFATAMTTVYRIRPHRGFDDAASVLGHDFAGGLTRDGWAPYRQFTEAFHQTCLGHLLRRCATLARDHPRPVSGPGRAHPPPRAVRARSPCRRDDLGAWHRRGAGPSVQSTAGRARRPHGQVSGESLVVRHWRRESLAARRRHPASARESAPYGAAARGRQHGPPDDAAPRAAADRLAALLSGDRVNQLIR